MCALTKSGGFLIAFVYPIRDHWPLELGPPYYVQPVHYDEVLGDEWEKVLDDTPKSSPETHVGSMRLMVYKKL